MRGIENRPKEADMEAVQMRLVFPPGGGVLPGLVQRLLDDSAS